MSLNCPRFINGGFQRVGNRIPYFQSDERAKTRPQVFLLIIRRIRDGPIGFPRLGSRASGWLSRTQWHTPYGNISPRHSLQISTFITMQLIKTFTKQQTRKTVKFDNSRNVTRTFKRKDAPKSIYREFKGNQIKAASQPLKGILHTTSTVANINQMLI